jgi:hypothetical protein
VRIRRFGLLAFVVAAVVAVSACQSLERSCTQVGCTDGPEVTLHFRRSINELVDATITTCLRDTCSSHRPRDTIQPAPGGSADLAPPSSQVAYKQGFLADVGEGWTTLSLFAANRGPFANGDRYRVAVVRADGAPMLDVERNVVYAIAEPNGAECGPTCHVATPQVYEDSPSGLTCTGSRCLTFLQLITHIPDKDWAGSSIITLCRNAVCATTDKALIDGYPKFQGELRAEVTHFLRDGVYEISISMAPDPAVLADGDVYRIRAVNDLGATLKESEKAVTYETSLPNGAACDLHPCRQGIFVLD